MPRWYPSPQEFADLFLKKRPAEKSRRCDTNGKSLRTQKDVKAFWASYDAAKEKMQKGGRKLPRVK